MIEFKNVSIKYSNHFFSLMNFNLKINSSTFLSGNEIFTSAIARALSKIDKFYTGDIIIDGSNLKKIKNSKLNIAYIPQIPYLFENKSIEFNLSYPLKIRKEKKEIIANKLELIKPFLTDLGITSIFNKANTLTNSQKKLICLLRATIREPNYFIIENLFEDLDELHTNLAKSIIESIKSKSIIIAIENNKLPDCYKDLKTINFN